MLIVEDELFEEFGRLALGSYCIVPFRDMSLLGLKGRFPGTSSAEFLLALAHPKHGRPGLVQIAADDPALYLPTAILEPCIDVSMVSFGRQRVCGSIFRSKDQLLLACYYNDEIVFVDIRSGEYRINLSPGGCVRHLSWRVVQKRFDHYQTIFSHTATTEQ